VSEAPFFEAKQVRVHQTPVATVFRIRDTRNDVIVADCHVRENAARILSALNYQTEAVRLIEQMCRDLNEAHDEMLRAGGCDPADFGKFDWPERSPQANSIRWAEKLMSKRLAKTNNWTLFPSPVASAEKTT